MIRVSHLTSAAAAALALAVVAPEAARASPQPPGDGRTASAPAASAGEGLPADWRISGAGAGRQLVWTSSDRVPMGDARIEFYAGDRLLGRPEAARDGRTFRLRLDAAPLGPLDGLKVLAGGRRLDAAGAEETSSARRSTTPAKPETPFAKNSVDPGVPGRHRTVSGEYDLKPVRLPGFAEPVEMRAQVVSPVGAPGRRPLALFLHGRHYTCFNAQGEEGMSWPCASGLKPVPSHRGYRHDQKLLASQGYVTVSISANGINGQDHAAEDGGAQARSSLVRRHLARWADWSEGKGKPPAAVRAGSKADLSRVLLVGHSRGGEGVNRAALDSRYRPPADQDGHRGPVRWRIRGTVLVGPTVFGHNPAPDVPSMTLLPGCDGDVSDLQGQIYLDGARRTGSGTALHSAVYMVGANHNFFNTEWTPGQAEAPAQDDFYEDDKPDPVCAPGAKTRLTARQQQKAGSAYIAAAARLFVAGDDKVRPLLDGSKRRAPSAGPARVLTHAVGGHRKPAILPDSSVKATGGRLCAQVHPDKAKACLTPGGPGQSPHFATWYPSPEPGRHAIAASWSKAGAPVRITPARPFSVTGSESLALRMIVPPNTRGTKLDVTLTDASGRRAKLGRVTVDGLPGSGRTASHWAREVRAPLSPAVRAKLDLKRIASLEITPRTRSGKAWLVDAWGWRPGTPKVRRAAVPRVDVGRLTVQEGDSGVRTYRVPVRVSGQGSGQVRVFVPGKEEGEHTSKVVTVRPGSKAINVRATVRGNTRHGYDTSHDVFVKAVRGAAVGSDVGGVTAQDDDPMPTVSVTPVADRVTEGQTLRWRVSLSAPSDVGLGAELQIRSPESGAELSTHDVDPKWLEETYGESPNPERPLSKVWEETYLPAMIEPGELSTLVSVPTVKDTVSEPEESTRLQLTTYNEEWEPQPGPSVTGTVRDAR